MPVDIGQAGMLTPQERRFQDEQQARIGQRASEDQRQRVGAAIAFHFGQNYPDMNWAGVVPVLTDQFVDMAGGNPQVYAQLENDVNSLWALTDDQIAEKVKGGQPLSELSPVFDSMTEVLWQIGAQEEAVRWLADRQDKIRGSFDALTKPELTELEREEGKSVLSSTFVFNQPGAWSYDPDAHLLAVTVGDVTVGVETVPGFEPQDHLDVVAQILRAERDGKLVGALPDGPGLVGGVLNEVNEFGQWVDEHPTAATTIDQLWDASTRFTLLNVFSQLFGEGGTPLLGDVEGPAARGAQRVDEEKKQVNVRVANEMAALKFPDELVIARLAPEVLRMANEQGQPLSNQDALRVAAMGVQENRSSFVDAWESATSDQLIAELESDLEGKSGLGTAIEGGLQKALVAMEAYDSVVQTIGVQVLARFPLTAALGLLLDDEETNPAEFIQTMVAAPFDGGTEAANVAEYYGLEGTGADVALLAVGIGFDPMNLLFPGAKGQRALFREAMMNPREYGMAYLRSGGVRSVTKDIAEKTGADALSKVFYLQGLSNDAYRALAKIAVGGKAEVRLVDDILLNEMVNGTFLGAGPNRAIRQSTIHGFARMVDSIAGGKLSANEMDWIFDMTAQLGRTRRLSLGENRGLSSTFDLIQQFYPNDPQVARYWMDEALTATDRLPVAMDTGTMAAMAQKAREQLDGAARGVAAISDEFDVAGMRSNKNAIASSMRHVADLPLDDAGREQVTQALRDQWTKLNADVDRIGGNLADLRSQQVQAHKALAQATRMSADLGVNSGRTGLADMLARFYEDLARKINDELGLLPDGSEHIPVKRQGSAIQMNLFTTEQIPERDWSRVTGVIRSMKGEDIPIAEGFALPGNKAAIEDLKVLGFASKQQEFLLPASPYETLLYRRIAGNPDLLAKAVNRARNNSASGIMRGLKTLFGMNLLWNGITPIKTTADETFRFFAVTGALGRTLKATTSVVPGSGALYQKTDELLRKIPGFRTRMSDEVGEFMTNPFVLEYGRSHEGFYSGRAYQWVTPKSPGVSSQDYLRYSEKWVNGTLLNDPLFRAYARWAPADEIVEGAVPQEFVKWWDEGIDGSLPGSARAKATEIVVGRGIQEVDAAFAYQTIDRTFNKWITENVAKGQQGQMRRRILGAARGTMDKNLSITADAHLLKAINQIPAPALAERQNLWRQVVGAGFDLGYGKPSVRRGSMFFEYFYDEALKVYEGRFKGRILTPEMLATHSDVDLAHAQWMLKQGSENAIVRDLLNKGGYRTIGQLRAEAAAYAAERSDDLMYRFTAGSMIGQGVESGLLFPYARAQVDFLSWWTDHLSNPQRIRPAVAKFLELFPKGEAVVEGIESIPLNLRALERYAHMAVVTNNEYESGFDQALRALTFFPFRFDSEFLLDVLPQPGPVPSWMIDQLAAQGTISEEVLANLEAIYPALGFTQPTGNAIKDFSNQLFPQSKRSFRQFAQSGVRELATLWGEDLNTNPAYAWLTDNRLPLYTGDFTTADYSDWLKENAFTVPPGGADWLEQTDTLTISSALDANKQDWSDTWKNRLDPFASQSKEYRYLGSYEGLFEPEVWGLLNELEILHSNETLLDDQNRPRIQGIYEKWQAGEATDEDKKFLSDALYRIYTDSGRVELLPGFSLNDYINIIHPEMTVNLISKNEGADIPTQSDEHREFKANYIDAETRRIQNVPPGETGTELIKDARRKGWIISRNPDGRDGWMFDAHERVFKSARRAIAAAWYVATRGYAGVGDDDYDPSKGREWNGTSTKLFDKATVTVGPTISRLLKPLGLDLQEGQTMSGAEFFATLQDLRVNFKLPGRSFAFIDGSTTEKSLQKHDDAFGKGLLESINLVDDKMRERDIDSVDDWPESLKEAIRNDFRTAIDLGYLNLSDYKQEMEEHFGSLDYQPPVPPPVEELGQSDRTAGITVSSDQINEGLVQVIDGDTLSILLDDGPMRIRLIGINAPEVSQQGYREATDNLAALIEGADEVTIGFFNTDLYGLTQTSAPGEHRLLAWLYVNGVPIYDPSVFTADNPRGAGVGGVVLDLEAILEAGR